MADYALISVVCPPQFSEILMAELAEFGFQSFQESETGFEGAIDSSNYDEALIITLFEKYIHAGITWKKSDINKENWNVKWEENYEPVSVDDKIIVRASFHEVKETYLYDIIINPKMSFGTGHHETTWLMMRNLLDLDLHGKSVLDAGCGTGVLGILAGKMGAGHIVSFDIEGWAVENARENFELNSINGKIIYGSVDRVPDEKFDVILANINKNVLLDQMEFYSSRLKPSGTLLISGFYEQDIVDMLKKASYIGMKKIESMTKNLWALVILSW